MDRKAKIALLFLVGAVLATVPAFYYLPGKSFTIKGKYNQRENMVAIGSANIPAGEDDSRIVLAAVGDIMLSRAVERKMIAKKDWKYPFLETAEITSGADITFGNLETTILPGARVLDMSFIFRADPKALEGLEVAGFDVLSLANNHTMNFGYSGLEATLQNLDGVGIGHIGAGLSEKSIYAPVIKEVEGVKIGFLAYTYAREQSHSIDGNIYGTAYANTDKMKDQVSELRNSADIVVISMHMGEEYQTSPNTVQKNFARAAVDAGAELVIGHHPHVVETFEKYNDGYIIYSLGNFVFDQMWSEETRLGAIAEITFENNKISDIRFVPVKIFDYAQPKLADGVDKDKILERLEANGD